jgi:pyruvate dehydrogenase E1 component alpha subunit
LTEDEFQDMDKEVKEIVAQSVEFAENSPEPDHSEITTDILA